MTRFYTSRCMVALCASLSLYGQSAGSPATTTPASPAPSTPPDIGFAFFRNVSTVSPGQTVSPLTAKGKFRIFALQTFQPSMLFAATAVAGIQQAGDFMPNYGQGGEAYAKRVGAFAANLTSGGLLSLAVLPTVFHQDPRYYRKGSGSIRSRIWYAVTRTLITRNDDGSSAFNYSQIGGLAGSIALRNAYYPDVNRTASRNASSFGTGIGIAAGFNVVREFSRNRTR